MELAWGTFLRDGEYWMMPDQVALVYVGNRDGNERYLLGYPKGDITQSHLTEIAASEGKSIAEMRDFLLAHGIWELPPRVESATIEEITVPGPEVTGTTPDSFREEPAQAPGEAASDKRRRRES